jgi:hypothetical protein
MESIGQREMAKWQWEWAPVHNQLLNEDPTEWQPFDESQ